VAAGVAVAAVGLDGAWRAMRRLPPGALASQLETIVLIVLVVAIAGGLGILVGGGRPAELLHFVYAIVAVGILPLADSLSRRAHPRTRGIATVLGAAVVFVVILRLFATG
jgi:hypothetical protein